MFELYDFDANFKAYFDKWLKLNKGKFKTYEEMEDAMPEVYMRWLNAPAAFLSGETPGGFFQKFDSAPELVKWMRLYDDEGMTVPDVLLDRISDLGQASVKPLIFTAKNIEYSPSLRAQALNLLKETEPGEAVYDLCIRLIDECDEEEDLADLAGELLRDIAPNHKDELLAHLKEVSPDARETYLDILSDCRGDERVYQALADEFSNRGADCALYAALLGEYGDERAIPLLTAALDLEGLDYFCYIEIKNAIEALGGEVEHERDFSGDDYYEMMKNRTE